ncbi:hypothetical protein FRB96_009166 [Tulasnella sp. 330]|nr:hypothetical protein FRB96_009166 [Tulasnella sp. 330]
MSGSLEWGVRVWGGQSGIHAAHLEIDVEPITAVAFSADVTFLAAGTDYEWDAKAGSLPHTIKGHSYRLTNFTSLSVQTTWARQLQVAETPQPPTNVPWASQTKTSSSVPTNPGSASSPVSSNSSESIRILAPPSAHRSMVSPRNIKTTLAKGRSLLASGVQTLVAARADRMTLGEVSARKTLLVATKGGRKAMPPPSKLQLSAAPERVVQR